MYGLEINIKTNEFATIKKWEKKSISFLVKKSLVNLVLPGKEHLITYYPVAIVEVGSFNQDSNKCTVQFYHPLHDTYVDYADRN
ncbi:uncharacterized protein LOC143913140 isoform X2 [Arctopsyche grandis]|uniref:uncharacterized protein LOC143913140 isoform X2 n=1 Tax=Arctopsyche grandis TaxID=121162 RepID=UPI00406D92E8